MRCSACGTENPLGNRFCSSCGAALAQPAPPQGQACARCGTMLAAGLRFCAQCGAPVATAPVTTGVAPTPSPVTAASSTPSQTSQQPFLETVVSFLRSVHQEKSGAAAAAVVLVVSALISLVGWFPLGIPSRFISVLVPQGDCTGMRPGALDMYLCSAKVGLLTILPPILIVVLLFLIRKQVTTWVGRLLPKLPEESRFLVAPVLATLMFVMAWSGAHQATGGQSGFLPQNIFPGIIGLFTFAVARFSPSVQRALGPFFDMRDRFPVWLRFVAALAVPLLLSLVITAQERVTQEALKEQFIVLVALGTSYLAMTPRAGDLLSGMRQMMPGQRRAS